MAARATPTDPRSIVTPEAFQVAPELLGLPLASPRRRLAAILIDLLCIGIVTAVTRSFALVLGVVIAVALVRVSSRRTAVRGNAFDGVRRFSVGCLGVGVGLTTLLIGLAVVFQDDLEQMSRDLERDVSGLSIEVGPDGEVRVERPAADSTAGRSAVRPPAEPADEPIEIRDAAAVRDGVSLYSLEEAIQAYVELRREGTASRMDRELQLALEERIGREFAADTVLALEERVGELRREATVAAERLREAEEELDDTETRGLFSWVRGLLDDLGLGFGWAALYTTALLAWTNGQTLGKRLLGVRVVRLDGQRITWWVGFERAGGYAAGFATGLLGFAQIFWDANRQAIHDRIVGTVVVREGEQEIRNREAAP